MGKKSCKCGLPKGHPGNCGKGGRYRRSPKPAVQKKDIKKLPPKSK